MSALILALVLSMTDASAATASTSADHPKPAPDPNRRICKSTGDNSGTHMQTRTCRTAAEWDQQERQVQQTFRDFDHTSAQNMGAQPAMGMQAPAQ